jgi:hypothetical protein
MHFITGQNGFAKAKPLNMHNKQLSAAGRRNCGNIA